MKKKLVEIVWKDIVEEAGWIEDEDHDKLHEIKTYGLLVSKTKDVVTIANTYDSELKKWGGRNKFPRGCILQINIVATVEV